MVVRLPKPILNDIAFFQEVIDERKKGSNKLYFSTITAVWQERLQAYDLNEGDPTKLLASPIDKDDKDKFINLYKNSKKGQYHFPAINNLRRPTPRLLFCPACGEDGTPNTLDHYLPKTYFPEFSIHLRNLIPMCDICQGIKLETYVDTNGFRKYLHPYFDIISQPLVWINIFPPYSAPKRFELQVDATLPNSLAMQVTRHAIGLHLSVRLEDYCRTKYLHLLKSAVYNRSHAKQDVTDLINAFLLMEMQKAINSWGAIFYRSVLRNIELIQYLQNDELPPFFETSQE